MNFPPAGFMSPPISLGQMIITDSYMGSSPVKSLSSGSNSDADSAIGERQPSVRASKPRSRNGCWTCRSRKVKCDEVRPKCGSCTRLNKDCGWGQRWKFDNLSIRTQRRNKHVSTTGSPSWDETTLPPLSSRQLQFPNTRALPAFTELDNEDEREKKALTRPPGTFNVILTPDSFSRLPEYGGLIKSYRSGSGGFSITTSRTSEDPDLVILHEFEDTPYFMALPDRRPAVYDFVAQVSYIPSVQRDIMDYGTRDSTNYVLNYQEFISKRIMPLGSRIKLSGTGGYEDALVIQSKSFQPLHHAICAITMLSLALKGQRHLLAGAFQHYHQAISACMSCTNIPSGALIYLHFILLLYDICCATQKCSPEGQMWAQHFHQLGRLAYYGGEVNEVQAYLLWYTLFLDAQSCLAGNPESGSFVRAYQMHGSALPTWRTPQSMQQQSPSQAGEAAVFAACFGLSSHTCSRFADLSQLALQVREDVDLGRGSIAEHQRRIAEFRNDFFISWNSKYPAFLPRDSAEAGTSLPVVARTVFDFACFQYSTAIVYLNTSMYRSQRLHNSSIQKKEIAWHTRHILAMASVVIAAKGIEQHHIIFSIFLAGVASSNDHDKNRAIGLISAMEGTGISSNVTKTRELLEAICAEQRHRVQLGGRAAEVDWITFSRERGIRNVNLGL